LCATHLQAQQVTVSAADYSPNAAPGSIVAAFGSNLATTTQAARSLPLPTTLAGVSVTVNGTPAPLFFVSPFQINYQIPPTTAVGPATIVVHRADGTTLSETLQVVGSAPRIFTLDQTGSGTGAILDGRTFLLGPFNVRTEKGEATILAVFLTGLGDAGSASSVSSRVKVWVGGVEARVLYAGPQLGFAGLDQINFELPASVEDHGKLPIVITVDGKRSATVTLDVPSNSPSLISVVLGQMPMTGIDSLKVTFKTITLKTDAGVEVALLAAPVTVDLLAPDSAAHLLKLATLKAGTYVGLKVELGDVSASYNGQPVQIKVPNPVIEQTFREPITITRDNSVGVKLGINLRDSLKRQDDGSYIFNPVITLERIRPTDHIDLAVFSGKVLSIDANAQTMRVAKGDDRPADNNNERIFTVDFSNATILGPNGAKLDASALAVNQKVEVAGKLDDRGHVLARLIRIKRDTEPNPGENRAAFARGTILAVDFQAQTFDMRLEGVRGNPAAIRAAFPDGLPAKLTVKWNDLTKFYADGEGERPANVLAVGKHVDVAFAEFKPPFVATFVRVMDTRREGVITDISGLPDQFIMAAGNFETHGIADASGTEASSPTALLTVKLTNTTRIVSFAGTPLRPADLTVGSRVHVRGDLTGPAELTAELVVVGGVELKGSVTPADVRPNEMLFALTTASGEKVVVRITPLTLIFVDSDQERHTPLSVTEFFRLLSLKTVRLEVEGLILPGTTRAVLAIKIKIEGIQP
jgi:uncharacterized protein (TIGR03437 family)